VNLTKARAAELAEELTTIPECPRSDSVIEALTKDLLRICKNEEEAAWLVEEARDTWEKWRGTAGLISLLAQRREQAVESVGRCDICTGMHVVKRNGTYFWCTCKGAVEDQRRRRERGEEDLVAELNRDASDPTPIPEIHQAMQKLAMPGPHKPRPMDEKPKTEEELDLDFDRRQARAAATIDLSEAILADPSTSKEQKEIARMNLRLLRGECA
jgi:hypothetical protein